MLAGWVLTDTPCINCHVPTVRRKDKSIVGFCVLCDHTTDPIPPISSGAPVAEQDGVVENDMDEELDEMMQGYKDEDIRTKDQLARDSISSLLGQKMLHGWTMMQECCPNEESCNGVPLMRNKQMQLFCVSCNSFIGENNVANGEDEAAVEISPQHLGNVGEKVESSAALATPVAESKQTDLQNAGIGSSSTLNTAWLVLEEKISQLALLLKTQSHPTDILQSSQAIHSCAQALAALKSTL